MYLFFSEVGPKSTFNAINNKIAIEKCLLALDNKKNTMTTVYHELGNDAVVLSFVTPLKKPLFHFKNSENNISVYLVGDTGLVDLQKIKNNIIYAYKTRFSDLAELEMLYNLIIVDHHKNVIFFLSDSYHCQTLYYSQIGEKYLVANTLKYFSVYPGFAKTWDREEIANTFLIGTQSPEKTLIKNVRRVKFSEFLSLPREGVKKIVLPESNYNERLTLPQCSSTIYDLTLESIKAYQKKNSIDLFFSGGKDSTAIARLLKKSHSKFNCHTYLDSPKDMNAENVYNALSCLNLTSAIFSVDPYKIIDWQEKAIAVGEADFVGVNSLNAALEFLMMGRVSKAAWTTGDFFHGYLKLKSSRPESMHARFKHLMHYNILSLTQIKSLMGDDVSILPTKNYLTADNANAVFNEIHSIICPAALYRLRNRAINYKSTFFFPARNTALYEFINTIPPQLTNAVIQHNNFKEMTIFNEFLKKIHQEESVTNPKKAWMGALVDSDQTNKIKNDIKNYVIHESVFLKNCFDKKLTAFFEENADDGKWHYSNFLFCLWSMDIFDQQFM